MSYSTPWMNFCVFMLVLLSASVGATVEQHALAPAPKPLSNEIGANAGLQSAHAQPAVMENIRQIFLLCATMYGCVAMMWILRFSGLLSGNGFKTVLLCVSWSAMSIGMHVLNKTLSETLNAPALLSIAQMLIAVVLVGAMSGRELLNADRKQLRVWLIVPMFFAAMLCSSFYTYEYISLSLLTVLRNLTPMVVLPIERMTMPVEKQPVVSKTIIGSLLIMLTGALVYGGGIHDFSLVGVGFAFLNLLLAASDRLIQRRLLTDECKGLPSAACTVVNNFVGIFPALCLGLATGQVSKMTAKNSWSVWLDPPVLALLLLSGVVGIGICYFGFECQRVISATSFFVLQNASKIVVVSAGVAFFGDPLSSVALLGLALSLGGSCLYSKAQMDATEKQKAEESSHLLEKNESAKMGA